MENERPDLINVHALGKFKFCHRAGIIAHESKQVEDSDDWEEIPKLNYLPVFDIAKLDEILKETTKQLTQSTVALLVLISFLICLCYFGFLYLAICVMLPIFLFGRKAKIHYDECSEISRRLKDAKDARSAHLGDPSAGIRKISWWGLLNNGEFTANVPQASFQSISRGLAGKPARIVSHHQERIPVVLHQDEIEQPKDYHLIRLAAYSLLIEENQRGSVVKWGIVLNPTTMRGLAIPISEDLKKETEIQLASFKAGIFESNNGTDAVAPPESFCLSCPYGQPKPVKRSLSEFKLGDSSLPINVKRANNGKAYHSLCGDRFFWLPPHAQTIDLGIKKN